MAGRRDRGRAVHGILLLDKPAGVRSNAALQRVKWLFRARKAGHTGSLDNPASGLLPICLGEATKLSGYLLEADKRYLADFHLGVCTETGDAQGDVRASAPVPTMDPARIKEVLSGFLGDHQQVPPMYSALKRGGKRLYELAYKGQEVEREARPVTIHALELLGVEGPVLHVDVRCSKGTYIRSLAEDVGQALGCGAHVSMLRRLEAGPFNGDAMVSLDAVEAASLETQEALDRLLLPMDLALQAFPRVDLPSGSAHALCHGQVVVPACTPELGLVRVYGARGEFLGVGEVRDDGKVAPRRLLAAAD